MLTAIGLHRYYAAVAALPNQQDAAALVVAGVVQGADGVPGRGGGGAAVVVLVFGLAQMGQVSWRQAASQNIHS